jgi:hypothetical protein
MERDCYRCGKPVKEDAAFCPACNAPQIRVSGPAQVDNEFPPPGEPKVPLGDASSRTAIPGKIQWGVFFRIALPHSAIVGFLTFLLLPVGLLLVLPLSLGRIITRYRQLHAGALRSGQGARMGAFMALLSFVSFLVFAVPTISVNRAALLDMIAERARQNPDPQSQALVVWFATTPGFIFFTAISMLILLVFFLIVGMASGALMTGSKNTANSH